MILVGVLTTTYFAAGLVIEQEGHGPDFVALNEDSYWGMVGFAFFMFEGIGCLLPVMRETEKPEQLPCITVCCLVMLCTIYVSFSGLCYYAWGSDLTEPVVTEMLPAGNIFVQVMKLLFCLNLVFSFPLSIVPTFDTLEALFLGKKETNTIEAEQGASQNHLVAEDRSSQVDGSHEMTGLQQITEHSFDTSVNSIHTNASAAFGTGESVAQYWKINAMRSLLVLLTVIIVLCVADKLDRVMAVAGAIFGMTNVLLLPALCHLKLTAITKGQKAFDIFIIIFALAMLVFGPATIVLQWKKTDAV